MRKDIAVLDFETYYDKEYSLSKMTTEAYIRDPRFQVIGVSVDDEWFTGDFHEVQRWLISQRLDNKYLVSHHTAFDGAILAWRFGIKPKFYFDTLSMARPKHGLTVGGSLKALATHYNIGEKGTEVISALGKRREDFAPPELAQYGRYCLNDVALTKQLFYLLLTDFPAQELKIIDNMIRMYTDPVLEIDGLALADHLIQVREAKEKLMTTVIGEDLASDHSAALLGHGDSKSLLMSNPKFAAVLTRMGGYTKDTEPSLIMQNAAAGMRPFQIPTKISTRTGKETYAFGKTDVGFKALLEHEDPRVQAVVAARLGIKSTLEETRTEAFIGLSSRGKLPILLNYYGAHTGRASGGDGLNLQNLPRGGALRKAIKAPAGHMLVACDSAQIEARIVGWLGGETELIESFRKGVDVYSAFASKIYNRPITKEDTNERFVGKTGILGLGFGVGALKFQATLKIGQGGISVDMPQRQAQHVVDLYRTEHEGIVNLWKQAETGLKWVIDCANGQFGRNSLISTNKEGFILPNSMMLRYPELRVGVDGMEYNTRKGWTKIYGAKAVENVVQALARIIVFDQMMEIAKKYRVVLTVHDEVVCCVPEAQVDECKAFMLQCMSTPPAWAPDLPMAAEAKFGASYGEAK